MDRIIIINAEKVGDLSVCLTFNDNTKQTIDVGDFIHLFECTRDWFRRVLELLLRKSNI